MITHNDTCFYYTAQIHPLSNRYVKIYRNQHTHKIAIAGQAYLYENIKENDNTIKHKMLEFHFFAPRVAYLLTYLFPPHSTVTVKFTPARTQVYHTQAMTYIWATRLYILDVMDNNDHTTPIPIKPEEFKAWLLYLQETTPNK